MLDFVALYTPYTLTVYASSFPLPVRSQDSLRGVWLELTPAGLPPARFRQLLLAHQHTKPDPIPYRQEIIRKNLHEIQFVFVSLAPASLSNCIILP